jgi:hypothetical protein
VQVLRPLVQRALDLRPQLQQTIHIHIIQIGFSHYDLRRLILFPTAYAIRSNVKIDPHHRIHFPQSFAPEPELETDIVFVHPADCR